MTQYNNTLEYCELTGTSSLVEDDELTIAYHQHQNSTLVNRVRVNLDAVRNDDRFEVYEDLVNNEYQIIELDLR